HAPPERQSPSAPTPHPACRPPSPTRGEGTVVTSDPTSSPSWRLYRLLPLWEKVADRPDEGCSSRPQRPKKANRPSQARAIPFLGERCLRLRPCLSQRLQIRRFQLHALAAAAFAGLVRVLE